MRSLFSWLRGKFGSESRDSARPKRTKRLAPSRRPRLEPLEDRSLMTAGMLDPTFGSGGIANPAGKNFQGIGYGMAVYSNAQPATAGDIVTAGWVSNKRSFDFGVVRYTSTGRPDPTFGKSGTVSTHFKSSSSSQAVDVAIQPDGKIVAAGMASLSSTGADFAVARYQVNGTLDASFGTGGTVTTNFSGGPAGGSTEMARSMFLQPDGKVVVVGATMVAGGTYASENIGLARYNANGTLDATFGSGGKVITPHSWIPGSYVDPAGKYGRTEVANAVLLSSGQFLVGGYTEVTSGVSVRPYTYNTYEAFVLRYNANGTLDTSFGSGGAVTLPAQSDPDNSQMSSAGKIAFTPNGEIVLSGFHQLALLHEDGSFDTSFVGGGIAPDAGGIVAVQSDGEIVTASKHSDLVSRYLPDGTPDLTFGSGGTETPIPGSSATALVIQADGKILKASGFTVARLLPSEPVIGALAASATTLSAGISVTLTASNVTDGNPGSTVTQVAFYASVNGASTLVGYGTQTSPGTWTYTLARPADWSAGTYTISAQAQDNYGALSDLSSLDLQIL